MTFYRHVLFYKHPRLNDFRFLGMNIRPMNKLIVSKYVTHYQYLIHIPNLHKYLQQKYLRKYEKRWQKLGYHTGMCVENFESISL